MIRDPNLRGDAFRKNKNLYVWWIYHRLTTSLRTLPSFVIVGTQKGGTTSLYQYLRKHPEVYPSFRKEIKYFDCHYPCGENWYQAHFPLQRKLQRNNGITGEGSPFYMFHPRAIELIAQGFPAMKIIVLLRNPVDRAYSHYHSMVNTDSERSSFREALLKEEERIAGEVERIAADWNYPMLTYRQYSYLARGRYAEQMTRIYAAFPREQVLVIKSEDLYENTADVVCSVGQYLGISPLRHKKYPVYNKGTYQTMDADTRQWLVEYFKPHNQRLYEILERKFDWDR